MLPGENALLTEAVGDNSKMSRQYGSEDDRSQRLDSRESVILKEAYEE